MKLKLTAAGFETYTGQMGVVWFEDGLSTDDVLPVDAVRIAGVMGAEWEDGTSANVSQIYLDNMNTPAVQGMADKQSEPTSVKKENLVSTVQYTEDELAAIADKNGIVGLRAIAEPMGIKGQSIKSLIEGILKATAPVKE